MRALLDTHVFLWWITGDARLSRAQKRVLARAAASPLYLCEISLWETAMLVSLGRFEVDLPLRDWLEKAAAPPLVERVGISPAIAAEVAALPDTFHRDPADRILVAAARLLGATLLTQDARIIDAGLVRTLA